MFVRVMLPVGCLFLVCGGDASVLFGLQPDDTKTTAERVMVIRNGAELKTGSDVVARGRLGELLKVTKQQNGWRWVPGKRGWISEEHVMSVDKAINYFTQNVERNPSSGSHWQRGIAYTAIGQFKKALEDFGEAIRRDSRNLGARNDRGNVLRRLGRLDDALRDFDAVIAGGSQHPVAYTNRGIVWTGKGDYDKALADFNSAIGIDARFAPAWDAGGAAREAKGDYDRAIENYRQAIKLDASFDRAHNNLAWLLATVSDEALRDGTLAIEHARKACESTGYEDFSFLDTLAAGYAEAGQFEEAVKWAKKAIAMADDAHKPAIENRLKLYKAGKPFRESRGS